MAKDPAFLFYPGDYLRDTQTLSEKSQVSYDRIMCEHMRNICISKQQLKFFTKKLNEDELEELMFVLSETDNGYQIEWVAESIDKRRAYSESRRNNRKSKPKKDMLTYDEHMENENENEDVNIIVDRIYLRYPSKCVVKNSSTGKSSKADKAKIKKMLKDHSESDLTEKIDWYVNECKTSKVYMKNFSTFLNNLPDTDKSHSIGNNNTLTSNVVIMKPKPIPKDIYD